MIPRLDVAGKKCLQVDFQACLYIYIYVYYSNLESERMGWVVFFIESNIRFLYQFSARILLSWRQVRKRRDAKETRLAAIAAVADAHGPGAPWTGNTTWPLTCFPFWLLRIRDVYHPAWNLLRSYQPVACASIQHNIVCPKFWFLDSITLRLAINSLQTTIST